MKIVVLAGGLSAERDVSINSGTQVCRALRARGHQAILLDIFLGYGQEGDDLGDVFDGEANLSHLPDTIQTIDPDLEKIKAMRHGDTACFLGPNIVAICRMADMVYMGLHGAEGENGKVQAAFDILGIKYTGSGYLGSALAMDKGIAKKLFQAAGIPTPEGFTVTAGEYHSISDRAAVNVEGNYPLPDGIGFPCVVKPCCGGSSVGVSIPQNAGEFEKALELAFCYEDEVVVERFIKGREFSVGVIDGKALPIIEIIPKTGFYDYKTKYQAGMAEDICPAQLSEDLAWTMQNWAVKVYRELKLEVYGRIDFLLDSENRMYCLEANTLPGMTPTSLLPQEAKVAGVEYGELCEKIIDEALKRYERMEGGRKAPQKMEGMTLEAVARAVNGTYTGPEDGKGITLSSITIDSRNVEKDCLFVAIKGQRVDGNVFVSGAYRDGAACCMSTHPPKDHGKPYIQVESCEQALKDMAEYYRGILNVKVVGITGSVGKTTTKEMIASVVSQKYDTLKTQGNFNNEIGLPLTIFRLRPHHQAAILEMGISDFGEMHRLSKTARPDACVITNIGQCHLENLGDRDGVLKAKTEIFDYMRQGGTAYLNGDDDKLCTLAKDGRMKPVYFGLGDLKQTDNAHKDETRQKGAQGSVSMDVCAENIQSLGLAGSVIELVTPEGTVSVTVPSPGRHMVSNALAAAAVGLGLGLSLEQIRAGIEAYEPVGGHGQIIRAGSLTILDDCYNANPASMKAGIDVLSEVEGRRIAIVGDMFELGEKKEQMHYEMGEYAAAKGIDVIVAVGQLGKNYAQGAEEYLRTQDGQSAEEYPGTQDAQGLQRGRQIQVLYLETLDEALEKLPELIREQDSVLVKASHAMHFEKIVEKLRCWE